jgi:Asp-tRNA(Asn)/Glu-tRNA(Gln) amidotransferase A subunit family amidase
VIGLAQGGLDADMEAGYPFQAPRKLFRGEPSDLIALKGVKVGVLGSWLKASNPEVSEVCRKAISELSEAGIQVPQLFLHFHGAVLIYVVA